MPHALCARIYFTGSIYGSQVLKAACLFRCCIITLQGGFILSISGSSFKDTGIVTLRRVRDNARQVCYTPPVYDASVENNDTQPFYKPDGTFIRVRRLSIRC